MSRKHRESTGRFHAVVLATGFFLVSACGGSVTRLDAANDARGAEKPRFRIECIRMAECQHKASVACGSKYDVVSEWHNEIPESELPGLNEASRPKDARDYNNYHAALPNRTGIESNEPMPLASIVVACTG
jgi:hypothetical protein